MKQLKRCAVFCFNADASDADVPMRNAIVLVFMDVKFVSEFIFAISTAIFNT